MTYINYIVVDWREIMFRLMRPQKEEVGKRIRLVKEELGVSLTELGDRLGLMKPTINSYVQGYTLAPLKVVKKLTKLTGKSMGWFYFGEMEEYIRDYLIKVGYEPLLLDYPEIPEQLKEEFLNNKTPGWENEFGYPYEESIDDVFADVYHNIMKEYFLSLAKEYVAEHSSLDGKKQEEAAYLIGSEVYGLFCNLGNLQYGETSRIKDIIEVIYESVIKDEADFFNDQYLLGKLINILGDEEQTVDLIRMLSIELTEGAGFNAFWGRKLVEVFQSFRPTLIKLYAESTDDDFYEWFEKE